MLFICRCKYVSLCVWMFMLNEASMTKPTDRNNVTFIRINWLYYYYYIYSFHILFILILSDDNFFSLFSIRCILQFSQNLDNWKSCRRKRVEHIIDRVVEVKKLEMEEHDRTRRKSKTFSEMLEERWGIDYFCYVYHSIIIYRHKYIFLCMFDVYRANSVFLYHRVRMWRHIYSYIIMV